MAQQLPLRTTMNALKSKILRPALTSHYSVRIAIPGGKQGNADGGVLKFLSEKDFSIDADLIEISCSEASLPGSSFATLDSNNDFMGVSTKNAYRRLYDDRADFTFYVNESYDQIKLFEYWMQYMAGEQIASGFEKSTFLSRAQYPVNYKSDIKILKYERDVYKESSNVLVYNFVDSFPISINSMPVSYDASNLLKVTVSFSYSRYYIGKSEAIGVEDQNLNYSKFGTVNFSDFFNPSGVPSSSANFSGNYLLNNNVNQRLTDFNSRA